MMKKPIDLEIHRINVFYRDVFTVMLADLFCHDGEKEYPVVRGIEWFTVVGADEEFGIRY